MKSRMQVQEMLYGALLTGLAILIPTVFGGWLQIRIPPFTATLGSHIPTMLAMFISPTVAVFVGIGSTIGFFMTLGVDVAARAAVHIIVGLVGAKLVRRNLAAPAVLALTAIPHALGEAIVVMLFTHDLYTALILVGVGTVLHHSLDAVLTLVLKHALTKAGINLTKLVPVSK